MKFGSDNYCYSFMVGEQSILSNTPSGFCFFKFCELLFPCSADIRKLCIITSLSQIKASIFKFIKSSMHLPFIIQRFPVLETKSYWRSWFLVFMTTKL